MKERFAGFLLMTFIVPLAVLGYLILVWVGFLGKNQRARRFESAHRRTSTV